MDYQEFADVTRKLALEAGDIIMDIYNADDFEVKSKSDDSPVTAADEAADAHISAGLAVPVRGVVYAPARGRLFYTDASGASVEEVAPFDKDKAGTANAIKVKTPDNDALIVVASKSHRDQATDDYINKYNVADMTGAGSSLKFCLVATGEADIYPRLGRTMEWDTAAGDAVLRGAGGMVIRFDDHTPFTYGKPIYENPFFIAWTGWWWPQMTTGSNLRPRPSVQRSS